MALALASHLADGTTGAVQIEDEAAALGALFGAVRDTYEVRLTPPLIPAA